MNRMPDDTAHPHDPKEPRARDGGHCVVLGASIAGLFAARVLSDTFDRVTVVDRDTLPGTDENRRGAPQGRHAHAILPAGTRGLQQMFPGLLEEFEADGVPVVREPVEMHFAPGGHLLCQEGRYADPTPAYQPTRPQLERQVRARVRELRGVEIIDRCEAAGLTGTPDRTRVTGVRLVLRVADRPGGQPPTRRGGTRSTVRFVQPTCPAWKKLRRSSWWLART
jgi:2-polyprenyl-6-methoxyphenol hydroxylase-like FAD-dependent oxidoreductase